MSPSRLSFGLGTSLEMIDRHYGHLVRGADDAFRSKLDAFSARQEVHAAQFS